jgi:hypothetical protein
MFFIPAWITNFIFLGTCWFAVFQMQKLQRRNPIVSIQFIMVMFCLPMVIVVARMNRDNPRLSLAFFLISVSCMAIMIRYQRLLPPRKPSE